MRFLLLIAVFFIIGALFIISNENLALSESQNLSIFYSHYSLWLNQVFLNTQILTGDVIKLSWLPNNTTNQNT